MSVTFARSATQELEGALAWYHEQRPGLAEELLAETVRILRVIRESPLRYRVLHVQLRRAPLRRFPYAVLYRVANDEVLVEAFFHGSRNPTVWIERDG
ncbi:MAG: type II toxin-antitoxin system RelE/ParE family toxin [Planctomycetota bacterium]